MAERDAVTIGASSGGVEALMKVVGGLPEDLPAPVFVVLHFPDSAPSALPRILDRAGPLEAIRPEDGEPIEPGRVYVAPPDVHLLVERDGSASRGGPKRTATARRWTPFSAPRPSPTVPG